MTELREIFSLVAANDTQKLAEFINIHQHQKTLLSSIENTNMSTFYDLNGINPLMFSTKLGYSECVKILLHSGFDPNVKDLREWTALHYAIDSKENLTDIKTMLIHAGADIESRDSEGWTLPFYAVRSGNEKSFLQLIHAGAQIGTRDRHGWNLWHHAVSVDSLSCLKILLSFDTSFGINMKTNNQYTPLMLAIDHQYEDCLTWLIQSGANLDSLIHGQNIYDYAKKIDPKISETLLAAVAKKDADWIHENIDHARLSQPSLRI